MEISFGYKRVKFPSNPKVCERFLEYIRKGPQEFVDSARNYLGDDLSNVGNAKDYIAKKRAELESK